MADLQKPDEENGAADDREGATTGAAADAPEDAEDANANNNATHAEGFQWFTVTYFISILYQCT